MKHIRTKLLYARELFATGLIIGIRIKGTDNPADQLTKPLSSQHCHPRPVPRRAH